MLFQKGDALPFHINNIYCMLYIKFIVDILVFVILNISRVEFMAGAVKANTNIAGLIVVMDRCRKNPYVRFQSGNGVAVRRRPVVARMPKPPEMGGD